MVKVDFKDSAEELEIRIYDTIASEEGYVNTNYIQEQLDGANGKPLCIRINSYGGEVFEGFAIYNMLAQYKGYKTTYIDGIGASIASVIAMAGNKVVMEKASMLMIHNASGVAVGTFKEMEQVADALKKINAVIRDVYKTKTNLSDEKIAELMDNESYLTAQECLDYGFADEIDEHETDETQTALVKQKYTDELDKRIKTLNELKDFYKSFNEKTVEPVKVEPSKPENKLKKFFNVKEKEDEE